MARTLVWRPDGQDLPSIRSNLETAIKEAEAAIDVLKSARTKLEIAYEQSRDKERK